MLLFTCCAGSVNAVIMYPAAGGCVASCREYRRGGMRKRSTARRPSEPWRSYVVRKDGSRVRNECYSPKGVRHGASMSSGSSEQVMG